MCVPNFVPIPLTHRGLFYFICLLDRDNVHSGTASIAVPELAIS